MPIHDPYDDLASWREVADEKLSAENERLRAELDAARAKVAAAPAPATEAQAPRAPAAAAPAEAPARPTLDEIQADVDKVDLNQTPFEFYEAIRGTEQPSATAPESKPQLEGEALTAALNEADKATDPDSFYAALQEAGALDNSSKRVYR